MGFKNFFLCNGLNSKYDQTGVYHLIFYENETNQIARKVLSFINHKILSDIYAVTDKYHANDRSLSL